MNMDLLIGNNHINFKGFKIKIIRGYKN